MDPDRLKFKSYFVLDWNIAVATRPGPFRATFRLAKKGATFHGTFLGASPRADIRKSTKYGSAHLAVKVVFGKTGLKNGTELCIPFR